MISIRPLDASLMRSAVVLIDRILLGYLSLSEGCRYLTQISHRLDLNDDPYFQVAIAVDSETDSFPLGEERKMWHAASLERKDRELAQYEDLIREETLAELRELRAHLESLIAVAPGVQ